MQPRGLRSPFKTQVATRAWSHASLALAGPHAVNGTGQPKSDQDTPGCDLRDTNAHAYWARTGMTPAKTYAWSIAMTPMNAAPMTENQNTRRKIGPSAREPSAEFS